MASLLRSYAAAHGLNSTHHAVVRQRRASSPYAWHPLVAFTEAALQYEMEPPCPFRLKREGKQGWRANEEEMDHAAERLAREMRQRDEVAYIRYFLQRPSRLRPVAALYRSSASALSPLLLYAPGR